METEARAAVGHVSAKILAVGVQLANGGQLVHKPQCAEIFVELSSLKKARST